MHILPFLSLSYTVSEASDMVTDFRIGHRLPHSGHRLSNWSQTFGFGDRTPSELVTDFVMW